MTQQIIAYGATVERSTNGTEWTEIPECKGIAIPVVQTAYEDVTHLKSPDGFREYIKGLKDAGEITVPCGYTAAGYEQQIADQEHNGVIHYRTTMRPQPAQSTGDVFVFTGYPTPQLEAGDVGSPVNMNIVIRTSGNVEWTRGTAA